MTRLLAFGLLLALVRPAAGQEGEAEKLFRGMEEKVRAAKTLRVRFDLAVTDAFGRKGAVRGTLLLGEGDRYCAEGEGRVFGEAVKFTEVSDGTRTSYRDAVDPKQNSTEKSPKSAGSYLRGTLPRWGLFLATLNLRRSGDLTPDALELSGFRVAGMEQLGGRDAQGLRYTLKERQARDALSMKVWLDAETGLPVKLAVTGGKSDWRDITETYGEFRVNVPVDAQQFELPK